MQLLLCRQAVMFRCLRWRPTPRPRHFGPGCVRRAVVLGLPTSGARRTFGTAASQQCALETHIEVFAAGRDDMCLLRVPPDEPPGPRAVALELKRPGRAAVVITARPTADNVSMVALRRSDQAEGEAVPLQLLEPALLDLAFPPLEPATAAGPAALDPAGCCWSRVVMRVYRFLRDNRALAGESGRDFCCRVVDGVGLAACGFRSPAEVRSRLVDTELWGLLPAAEGSELPTAEWWAAWCFGDMHRCQPIGRSLPAHAVLASLLQLAGEVQVSDMSERSTRVKLFAERAVAVLKRAETERPPPREREVVKELFVGAAQQVPPAPSDDGCDLCFAARSVAIEAVQAVGGRFLHQGIARRAKTGERLFEAVRDRFLEVGRVAAKRHGTQDMGVAGPDNAPGVCLATMASTGRCCHAPLTVRESDYSVAHRAADLWLSRGSGVDGSELPLCATFAGRGQGKTVQLLLTVGLLVEARGGAGLFASSDQVGIEAVLRRHKAAWAGGMMRRCEVPTAEQAMAVAVLHRACIALVSSAKAASRVDTLLEEKVFLSHSVRLKMALSVARALVGCRPADPLFVAIDEVARFPVCAGKKDPSARARISALNTAVGAAGIIRYHENVVPIMGAVGCFDFAKLATFGARSVFLMPLSPLIPMNADLAQFLPPIARAVCLERHEFENPSPAVRKALGRVGALLMSTGGHGRVLNSALEKLQLITEEQVRLLKQKGATEETATVVEVLTAACDEGHLAVVSAATCDLYECASLRHPRLTTTPVERIEARHEAASVLRHLTTPFELPNLSVSHLAQHDPTRVLRRHMPGAWEFAAVSGRPTSLKHHPPPVALPAVLSRFLVDATRGNKTAPEPVLRRLTALFDLVLEMNLIVMLYARDATGGDVFPRVEEVGSRERAIMFEFAAGRVITLLLTLPTSNRPWLAEHTQLCSGAHTVDLFRDTSGSPFRTAGPAPTPAADQADPFRPSPLHQPAHPAAAAPPEAKPQGGLAAELRARDAMEQALRAEVHRLKEENAALRKGSDRAGRLESELQFLKAASVMQAGDPKAPLRLRQLEVDNARLRQENTRLNDRLRALESDEHRQRVLDHHSFMLRSTAARLDTDAASPASQQAAQAPVATDGERSVLVVRGQAPSAASRFQIQVHERAAAAEKAALTAKLRETEAKLEAASAELEKVQQWVTSVVAAHQQYPTLASTVPTTQLASPSARGWAPEGSMPSALQAQRSRLPTVL